MFRSAMTCAAAALLAGALCAIPLGYAGAQVQTQGQTVNSPPLAGSRPPSKTPKANTKAKRTSCTEDGKKQGLKGRKLKRYVKKCVKKPM